MHGDVGFHYSIVYIHMYMKSRILYSRRLLLLQVAIGT